MTSTTRICIKTSSIQGFFEYFFKTYFWFICEFVGECKNTCRFHRFFSSCVAPQTRNLGGIPAITFTDWGGKTHHVCKKKRFDSVWCLKKMRTRKKRKKRKEEIRMKDERVVCSLKLCSFLARGQSNWTRDESHACCRPQRMCNAQSLTCLLLLAHVLSSTGVTRFNAFLQNLGNHEPSALSFYFLLVRRRSRT